MKACDAPDFSIPEAVHIPFSSYLYTFRRKRLRIYTIVVFSFIRTFAPSF